MREHLANERTLLSWVRTGVGLISIGIVVERAGVIAAASPASDTAAGASAAFGLALAILGCLSLVMGTVQFLRNRNSIASGTFAPGAASYLVIVAGSLALAGAFLIFTLL